MPDPLATRLRLLRPRHPISVFETLKMLVIVGRQEDADRLAAAPHFDRPYLFSASLLPVALLQAS